MQHANRSLDALPPSPRASLVGTGRVGSSLARWLVAAGFDIRQVASRRAPSAEALATELSAVAVPVDELSSTGDALLLLAIPDPALGEVATTLAARGQAAVALHTAGSVGAEVLAPLRAAGAAIGSMHPLRAFVSAVPATEAPGTFFAVDGDPAAVDLAGQLSAAWSSHAEVVPPESRLIYHLAATFAAGGVVTLVTSASRLAEDAGISPAVRAGYLALAEGALENLRSSSEPAHAITGPAARGEVELLGRQFAALAERTPEMIELLAPIVREAVRGLARSGRPVANEDEVLRLVESWVPTVKRTP